MYAGNVILKRIISIISDELVIMQTNISLLIKKILKINVNMIPESFLLGLMNNQLERKFRTLLLNILTVVRILYAERLEDTLILKMEEWMVKVLVLAEI